MIVMGTRTRNLFCVLRTPPLTSLPSQKGSVFPAVGGGYDRGHDGF